MDRASYPEVDPFAESAGVEETGTCLALAGKGGQAKRVPGACCAEKKVAALGADAAGAGGTDSMACKSTSVSDSEFTSWETAPLCTSVVWA